MQVMAAKKNYDYLEKEELTAYVKYNTLKKNKIKLPKKHKTFSKENLLLQPRRRLLCVSYGSENAQNPRKHKNNPNRIHTAISHYQAQNCEEMSAAGVCFKAQGNRSIERNHTLKDIKEKNQELLTSQTGIQKETTLCRWEPVFAK